jgi:hypothetical protein
VQFRVGLTIDKIDKYYYTTVCGYKFVKIGDIKQDIPITVPFNKKIIEWDIAIDFINIDNKKDLLKAEQSVYLILENNNLVYTGYYSNSFKQRWGMKKGKYTWHGKDDEMKQSIKDGNKLSIWLTIDPYIQTKNGKPINISKFIEDEIIMKMNKNLTANDWNITGKDLEEQKNKTIKVSEILGISLNDIQ